MDLSKGIYRATAIALATLVSAYILLAGNAQLVVRPLIVLVSTVPFLICERSQPAQRIPGTLSSVPLRGRLAFRRRTVTNASRAGPKSFRSTLPFSFRPQSANSRQLITLLWITTSIAINHFPCSWTTTSTPTALFLFHTFASESLYSLALSWLTIGLAIFLEIESILPSRGEPSSAQYRCLD